MRTLNTHLGGEKMYSFCYECRDDRCEDCLQHIHKQADEVSDLNQIRISISNNDRCDYGDIIPVGYEE